MTRRILSPLDPSPQNCAATLMESLPQVVRQVRAEMRRQAAPFLSLSQLRALIYLQRCPQGSLSEVADYLDVSLPTMSSMVQRLVERGWVERTEDPGERRRLRLSLTSAGEAQLQQTLAATQAYLATALAPLRPAQRAQIQEGFLLLVQALSAESQHLLRRPETETL
ncbi:MAG: MarR family transcriptional regulator [Thermostichus sp. DG02_5_bins_236]